MLSNDKLLTVADVERLTSWSRNSVVKVFPFRRLGGRYFILRSEFERTLREGDQHDHSRSTAA